jgi:hypothetical protein
MDFSDNYLLSLGTFLPLVGVLVMLFVPGTQEKLHKELAILTSGATRSTRSGSRSSGRTTRSASTASACRSTSCRCS